MVTPKRLKKEKYPYQFHKKEFWFPIYWRYKNEVDRDFKEGFCGNEKVRVGKTTSGKYWVVIIDQTRMESPGSRTYKHLRVYCSEIEWLYEEDMKVI